MSRVLLLPADVDPVDVDLLPLFHVEGDVDGPGVGIHLRQGGNVGKGIPLVTKGIGYGEDIGPQFGAAEDLPR